MERVLFGGPASPLTLRNSKVTDNALSGGPGLTLQGGEIFTPGFPATLTNSIVAHNTPMRWPTRRGLRSSAFSGRWKSRDPGA
jgi:hypothetical protein